MKKLLLPLLLIIALPALAQETEYRITSQKSIDCDKETLFAYNSSGSINPSCVKEIIDLWGKENIDSLFYDADGKLISRDYYEYYEGETEHIVHAEYSYNEKGLKTNVKYFDGDGYRQEPSEEVFFYYNDNNQMIRMEYSIDGVVEEKYEYSYNDKGLMLEEIAYEDYGWGSLSICGATNPIIEKALNNLTKLKDCEAHATYIVEKADLDALRSLLINLTCEPIFYNEY